MEILYLDVCCLKRPFDDQRDARVRSEAAAVADVFESAEGGAIQLVRSSAQGIENAANQREDRRLAVALWRGRFASEVALTADVEARARTLGTLGFTPLDALHLAFAEAAGARFFARAGGCRRRPRAARGGQLRRGRDTGACVARARRGD